MPQFVEALPRIRAQYRVLPDRRTGCAVAHEHVGDLVSVEDRAEAMRALAEACPLHAGCTCLLMSEEAWLAAREPGAKKG